MSESIGTAAEPAQKADRPLRIVLMTDSYHPTVDGMVFVVDSEKKALERLGHQVFIIAPDPGEKDRIEGVYYFKSAKFSAYDGYYLPIYHSNVRKVMKSIDPDVVHSNGLTLMALKGFIGAHGMRVPYVVTMGTMVTDAMKYYMPVKLPINIMEKLSWVYLRALLNHSDAVVSFTAPILEELKRNGVEPRASRVITAGVDTDIFHPVEEPEGLRESMGLVGKRAIMCVGRLSFEKHVEQVVQALKYLPDDVDLIIDGDGPAQDYIRTVIAEEHQESRVHLIGMVKREDLPKYYTMVEVCVSASRFETQGLSLMEAMACRVPIVVPAVRAFKEIIIDNENGYLFDGDIEDMAKRVTEALDTCHGEIREKAMERARSYSEESSAVKLEELYREVIESKKERLAAKSKKR